MKGSRTSRPTPEQTLLRKLAWCLLTEGEFIGAVTDGRIPAGDGTAPLTPAEIETLREARAHHEDRAWSHVRSRARSDGMPREVADEGRRRGLSGDVLGEWVRARVDAYVMDTLVKDPWPWQ